MLYFVFLGRQGSGKGTQSALIAQKYGCVHVSTGDMLRSAVAARSELGLQAEALMLSGKLVSDDITIGIVAERLQEEDVINSPGVLLDGFPRNLKQAKALETILSVHDKRITAALDLEVPVETVTERLLQRGRSDDTERIIDQRLAEYETQTLPLIDWYRQEGLLFTINGSGTVEEVFDRIVQMIESTLSKSLSWAEV